jgi:hypothetical protein
MIRVKPADWNLAWWLVLLALAGMLMTVLSTPLNGG